MKKSKIKKHIEYACNLVVARHGCSLVVVLFVFFLLFGLLVMMYQCDRQTLSEIRNVDDRYGVYYNPIDDVFMAFVDEPDWVGKYRYVLFATDSSDLTIEKADYVKLDKYNDMLFTVYFYRTKESKFIEFPSDALLNTGIAEVKSQEFVIDTTRAYISKSNILRNRYDSIGKKEQRFSRMVCNEGIVTLSCDNSHCETPLKSLKQGRIVLE